MAVIQNGQYYRDYMDDAIKHDAPILANRDLRVLEMKEDGSFVKMWVSASMDATIHIMWHPASLYQEILDNVGLPAANLHPRRRQ